MYFSSFLSFEPDHYESRAPWGEAAISQRAQKKLDEAKLLFDRHIATVDTSDGEVSTEGCAGG
jgi:hypothetical protein